MSRSLFGPSHQPLPSTSNSHLPRKANPSHRSQLKRTESIISLPSPPMEPSLSSRRKHEAEVDALGPRLQPGFGMDLALRRTKLDSATFADEDDQFSDDEGDSQGYPTSRNPFLMSAFDDQQAARRPDHPQASPTHARRRRIDRDRIQLGAKPMFGEQRTPPPGVPEAMGKGWEDEANPFIERKGERNEWKAGKAKAPEKVAYVL